MGFKYKKGKLTLTRNIGSDTLGDRIVKTLPKKAGTIKQPAKKVKKIKQFC